MSVTREEWGSRFGFIVAAAGSAVGLGNIWRFPYLVGMNGGAAFVLVYVALAITVGITVMIAEFALGRAARKNSVGTFRILTPNRGWHIIGWLGLMVGGFIILSYYGIIAGWTIKYMIGSLTGMMDAAAAGRSGKVFDSFLADSSSVIFYQVLSMFICTSIVACGVSKGIERACKVLMPALFVILIILVVRSVTLPGAYAGIEFYLKPDFSKLTSRSVLDALSQGFFSLSLGMGIMITYGSYIKKEENLGKCALMVLGIDTGIALLAGLAIFPAVFAMGVAPEQGVGLTFITLPGVFSNMPFGSLFSSMFFTLLFFAALTSMISLQEVAISYVMDEFSLNRVTAALGTGIIITLMGIPSALSLAPEGSPKVMGKTFFDFMDFISNSVMMPLCAIGISIFVGWVWAESAVKEVTNNGLVKFSMIDAWLTSLKFFAPVAIGVILLRGLM